LMMACVLLNKIGGCFSLLGFVCVAMFYSPNPKVDKIIS
jgi:hypothetical protein